MFDTLLAALQPYLAETLALIFTGLLGIITAAVRKYLGLQAEAILRDALHRALTTGVTQATSSAPDTIAEQAVEYARRSVPDAIKRLGASPDVLIDLARAKIREAFR